MRLKRTSCVSDLSQRHHSEFDGRTKKEARIVRRLSRQLDPRVVATAEHHYPYQSPEKKSSAWPICPVPSSFPEPRWRRDHPSAQKTAKDVLPSAPSAPRTNKCSRRLTRAKQAQKPKRRFRRQGEAPSLPSDPGSLRPSFPRRNCFTGLALSGYPFNEPSRPL